MDHIDIFVRTSSTTSTLSTSTVCFVTDAAAPTTCKKRKRSLVLESAGDVDTDSDVEITPSRADTDGGEGEVDVEGSPKEGRLANNLLYWVTTTSTSTFTSYTATSTIGSVECTPPGKTIELCG